jgi:hypothetical protein
VEFLDAEALADRKDHAPALGERVDQGLENSPGLAAQKSHEGPGSASRLRPVAMNPRPEG